MLAASEVFGCSCSSLSGQHRFGSEVRNGTFTISARPSFRNLCKRIAESGKMPNAVMVVLSASKLLVLRTATMKQWLQVLVRG